MKYEDKPFLEEFKERIKDKRFDNVNDYDHFLNYCTTSKEYWELGTDITVDDVIEILTNMMNEGDIK